MVKIACSRNLENEEFCRITVAEGTCLKFCGPAGACSLSARIPFEAGDMACGDDSFFVSRIVQAIFSVRERFRKSLVEKKICDMITRFGP